jgi:hypothetical protein
MPPVGILVATIYGLHTLDGFREFFEQAILPRLEASGVRPAALLETEPTPNNFPRPPIREGEHTSVWFARFPDMAAYEQHVAALGNDPVWHDHAAPALDRRLAAPVEVWRLVATARSRPVR